MSRRYLVLLVALTLLQGVLGVAVWSRSSKQHVTYVFTPMVDVVPGGAPLTGAEATDLAADFRHQVDQRDIKMAYARMGSTLSMDDLLRGIEDLESNGLGLDERQKAAIGVILSESRSRHGSMIQVQRQILELEAQTLRQVGEVLAMLPPDSRARVEAAVRRPGPGAKAPPPSPMPPPSAPPLPTTGGQP